MIDIDRQAPAGVIGDEATRASADDSDQFLATQIRLIQADAVLRPVAQKYKLLEREQQFQDWPQWSAAQVEERAHSAAASQSDRGRPTPTCC